MGAAKSYGSGIADAAKGGFNKIVQGVNEAKPIGGQGLGGFATGVGKILGGATEVATSPIAPAVGAAISPVINAAADKISNTPLFQGYGKDTVSMGNQELAPEKITGAIGDYANAAGVIAGGVEGSLRRSARAAKVPEAQVPKPPPSGADPAGPAATIASRTRGMATNVVNDILPAAQRSINHQVAKAFDLTPGDLNNIFRSTGNDVGEWISKHNLIGDNVKSTEANLQNFFKQNYDSVRSEIAKDKTVYAQYQIPRFVDALNQIKQKVAGVPGLEKVHNEVQNLLIKPKLKLEDVQRVKELMDKHFSLYKVTGDVGESVAKEGLANMRHDLQSFIENKVEKNTGADIRDMNRNVATSRSITEAITTRSQRGLTRAHLTWRDVATGFVASQFGGPLVGLSAVVLKKIAFSPTMRLRTARYLDQFSDFQRAKIKAQLQKGQVPKELEDAANGKDVAPSNTQ